MLKCDRYDFTGLNKIKELIESNWDFVPEEYRPIFDQLLVHIYAFEKHCHDATIDYSNHQFPQDFTRIIDDVCAQEAKRGTDIEAIENRLEAMFEEEDLPVIEGYLTGSVLRGVFEGSDVDAFLLLNDTTPDEIKASGQKLEGLKQRFFSEFARPLHSIVFSQPESGEFYKFLENLSRKRKFI